LIIALPWLSAKHIHVSLSEQAGALLAVFAVLALFALVGLGTGALLKNQIVAVTVGVIFMLAITPLLLIIPGVKYVYPYLPAGAVSSIVTDPNDHANRVVNGVHLIAPGAGVAVLVAWALVLAVLAAGLLALTLAGCSSGGSGYVSRSNHTCAETRKTIGKLKPPADPKAGLAYALDRYVAVEKAVSTLTDSSLPGGPTGRDLRDRWLRPARTSLETGDADLKTAARRRPGQRPVGRVECVHRRERRGHGRRRHRPVARPVAHHLRRAVHALDPGGRLVAKPVSNRTGPDTGVTRAGMTSPQCPA
jgi:hypothetical protein